jgi:hypothetical protein
MPSFLCSDARCGCILTRYPDEDGGFWWGCNGPRCQRTYGDLNGAPDYQDAQRPEVAGQGSGEVSGIKRGYLGRTRRGARPTGMPGTAGAATAGAGSGWQFKRLV